MPEPTHAERQEPTHGTDPRNLPTRTVFDQQAPRGMPEITLKQTPKSQTKLVCGTRSLVCE